MSRYVERDEGFDDMLNDCYEPYKIGDLVFYPADILYNCDPIAYSISVSEYEDYERELDEDEAEL